MPVTCRVGCDVVSYALAPQQLLRLYVFICGVCLQVNVEEVKREHKKAADAVVEAVHTALSEGLRHAKPGAGGSKPVSGAAAKATAEAGTAAVAAAVAVANGEGVSPGSKRQAAVSVAAGDCLAAAKKRKTMLDMLEGAESDEDSSSAEESSDVEA
jgi:hypothetical protein